MKKRVLIPIMVLVISAIGTGGFFAYKYLNKEPIIVQVENPFYENIGELAVKTNEKYGVKVEDKMIVENNDFSFSFDIKNFDNHKNYYYEDNIIFVNNSLDNLKYNEVISMIANYLKVSPEVLLLNTSEQGVYINSIDNSWKILNSINGNTFTLMLTRLNSESDNGYFSYENNKGEKYFYLKSLYTNVDYQMKQSPYVVSFDLIGENVDTINIKEIDELFEGEILNFIKKSLENYKSIELDYNNKKEYNDIYNNIGISIVGDYNDYDVQIKNISLIQLP